MTFTQHNPTGYLKQEFQIYPRQWVLLLYHLYPQYMGIIITSIRTQCSISCAVLDSRTYGRIALSIDFHAFFIQAPRTSFRFHPNFNFKNVQFDNKWKCITFNQIHSRHIFIARIRAKIPIESVLR